MYLLFLSHFYISSSSKEEVWDVAGGAGKEVGGRESSGVAQNLEIISKTMSEYQNFAHGSHNK